MLCLNWHLSLQKYLYQAIGIDVVSLQWQDRASPLRDRPEEELAAAGRPGAQVL